MIENGLENVWSEIIDTKYEAYYQPQYNMLSHEITGFEALARLNDSTGLVSPSNFISIIEKNGMIVELDKYIFESACKLIKKFNDTGLSVKPICVNLSRYDFYESTFIDKLEKIRKKYDVDAKFIGLELTETFSKDDKELLIEVIKKFHKYGYTVLLDNFNGEDQELSFIDDINYDIVKLDVIKLIKKYKDKSNDVIKTILKRVRELKIKMIVQGVETQEQAEFLKSNGCKHVQGYYYAKPMEETKAYNHLSESINDSFSNQQKTYKTRFENLLEQLEVYYWEYDVKSKEMHPCYRSIKDFGLPTVVQDCPENIINKGIISKHYIETYREIYREIEKGTKSFEAIIKMGPENTPYIIRCDTEFDEKGEVIGAHCSAVKVNKNKTLFGKLTS